MSKLDDLFCLYCDYILFIIVHDGRFYCEYHLHHLVVSKVCQFHCYINLSFVELMQLLQLVFKQLESNDVTCGCRKLCRVILGFHVTSLAYRITMAAILVYSLLISICQNTKRYRFSNTCVKEKSTNLIDLFKKNK